MHWTEDDDESVSLEQIERAMATCARIIEKHGPATMPIFERLERARDGRLDRERRLAEAKARYPAR